MKVLRSLFRGISSAGKHQKPYQKRQLEAQMLGQEKMNFLLRDLGILEQASRGVNPSFLGRELVRAIQRTPEKAEIIAVLIKEAGEIEQEEVNILSPRQGIILAARDALGLSRRGFLRAMATTIGASSVPVRIFYPQDAPEFSESRLLERILQESLPGRNSDGFFAGWWGSPTLYFDAIEPPILSLREALTKKIEGDLRIRMGMSRQELEEVIQFWAKKYDEGIDSVFGLDSLPAPSQEQGVEDKEEPAVPQEEDRVDPESILSSEERELWPIPWLKIVDGFFGPQAILCLGFESSLSHDSFLPY